ncbi:hypothetical protein KPP03845_104710 [Streptomyces xanthophaeus]|nr:hypothetical protein [Streptomyces xanthophaeus]WCD88305.1 hypothetical protein KPP03845_104710 [Streptomyces xanthophaeus]
MDAAGGWFYFLAAPRARLIVVVRIVPPFAALQPAARRVRQIVEVSITKR